LRITNAAAIERSILQKTVIITDNVGSRIDAGIDLVQWSVDGKGSVTERRPVQLVQQ